MKKIMDLLTRGRRKQDNFYSLHDASLCDNTNYNITQKNIYKYFQFDSDCYDSNEPKCGISFDQRAGEDNELQDCTTHALSTPHFFKSSLTEMFDLQLESDFRSVKSEYPDSGSVASFHKPLSSSESPQEKLLEKQMTGKTENQKNKSRKSLYVININNSKCFHIGSQRTIHFNEKETSYNSKAQECSDGFIQHLNLLLDCDKKLNEESIMLISLHLDNQWKEFVKYLGIEESFFEELEFRNDNNRILIIYDALQKFINIFPNTTFGFVINVLNQTHQVAVIKKLMKELNS